MKDKILEDLYDQVKTYIDNKSILDYSLLGQDFGCILFLYFYSKKVGKNDNIDKFLDKMFSGLLCYKNIGSYCNGLAGLGIGLSLMEKSGLISGVENILHNLDGRLVDSKEFDFKIQNIDFLHGVIGIGFYLIYRYNTDKIFALKYISKILDFLDRTALCDNDKIYWILPYKESDKIINISISHGMSSILIFLSRLTKYNLGKYHNDIVIKLLRGVTKYIIAQKIEHLKYGSYFPSFSKSTEYNIHRSRLAWCYGDLGVAIALKEVATTLNDDHLYNFSIEVLTFSAKRRDLLANGVYDACLCHGAAGVSLIFYRIFEETKNEVFFNAYKYWNDKVFDLNKIINGKYVFPIYNAKTAESKVQYGILEGLSGIGLYMLDEYDILEKLFLLK